MSGSLDEIKKQVLITLECLREKSISEPETIVLKYLDLYESVANIWNLKGDAPDKGQLVRLLDLARGYLETSSRYDQEFLSEMAKVENLIRNQFSI